MKFVCALAGLQSAFDPTYGKFSLPFHQLWLSSPNRPESLPSLPNMDLIFRGDKSACCYIEGRLVHQDLKAYNFMPIIGSLPFLRNFKDVTIIVPPHITNYAHLARSIARFGKYMMSSALHGPQWMRSVHIEHEAQLTTFTDWKLDDDEGTTAAFLRRDRFEGWQEYESHIGKILELGCLNRRRYLDNLRKRHTAYQAFNSMSKIVTVEDDRTLGDDRERFSRWRQQYPHGIPPFNSSEFRELMEKYSSHLLG